MTVAVARKRADNPFPFSTAEAAADVQQLGLLHELTAGGDAGPRRHARALYWMGWRISHIADYLGIARTTLHDWAKAEKWAEAKPLERVEGTLEARLCTLINKESKTGGDFKEIDLLGRQIERLARVHKYEATGKEADLNPNIERRNAGPKKWQERNHFSEEMLEKLKAAFIESLFKYQLNWWQNSQERTRAILKSRQIGATWYFAREALIDALETGRNQIFLSASRAQAHIFRQYIMAFAKEVCEVDLSGDPIVLSNGATLYFLGTNARTAQGYHGNFYFDEFFWTHKFDELNKVASGMAMHKRWRKTYFSTPSSLQHQAYGFWSGSRINRKRSKADRIALDLSHDRLAGGFTGEDKVWRQIVTIQDAEAGGCDLFDLDELRFEYSPEEFENLLMCGFVDESFAVFPLTELMRCHVDSWDAWAHDFKPFALRPFAYKPVWIGYDPSHTGDAAGLVVMAPPDVQGGKFRVLERMQFRNPDFEAQAGEIEKLTKKYNVQHICIDTTGLGQGVYQIVKKFFPGVKALQYSVDVKTRLVLKAQSVMRAGRLEFDAGDVDLQRSFMAIKREMTASGRSVTYAAGRSEEAGHADLAWACMNAMDNEPLEAAVAGAMGGATVEFFG
ncbi:terminase family protein [Comamonas sp. Y33R10-2]|nr:terminase family protein [Comamonas sp. Y33R10-2]